MREQQGHNRGMRADELADLLRWCSALSTDPADLAGAVVLAAGPRWSRLVDSPPDLRELTVRTFLRAAEPAEAIPRQFTGRTRRSFKSSSSRTTGCRSCSGLS